MTVRAAIIGTGMQRKPDGTVRRGISYHHAPAYLSHPDTELVALADIKPENALAYAEHFTIKPAIYPDYRAMLAEAKPDIVSICVWTALHPEIVIGCAEAGVRAIHCEKPMAPTWGEARKMAAACEAAGVQLTFNHQRRFGKPFRTAKSLLKSGVVGDLVRLEGRCPNMMDWGTHWLDMFFFYNDDIAPSWVLGQIDKRTNRSVFGLQMDDQAVCWFGFANDVQALLLTGQYADHGPFNRIIGTRGVIEVAEGANPVRYQSEAAAGWQVALEAGSLHGPESFEGAIHDAIDSMTAGREPELAARKALQATEVIFATYESSRYRGRIDLPLEPEDSALLAMLESGQMGPERLAVK